MDGGGGVLSMSLSAPFMTQGNLRIAIKIVLLPKVIIVVTVFFAPALVQKFFTLF